MSETTPESGAAAAPAKRPRRLRRWAGFAALGVVVVAGLLVTGGWLLLRQGDLAGLVAGRAQAVLGREVTIGRLLVVPGRWIRVQTEGVSVAGLASETGKLLELRSLQAEVDALALLRGRVVTRGARVEGLHILLERAEDRTPNWRFGSAKPAPTTPQRGFLPTMPELKVADLEVVYRTTSGQRLVTQIETASLSAVGDDGAVTLTASGRYNDVPVTLEADLGSFRAYRDRATPYPAVVHLAAEPVRLSFEGTMVDPLNLDGVVGTLTFDGETMAPILAMARLQSELDPALHLTGDFSLAGGHWALRDAFGALNDDSITDAVLRLDEGVGAAPDQVEVTIGFDRLDLNALLGGGPKGKRGGADVSLAVERVPDVLGTARISARTLLYAELEAGDAVLAGKVAAGAVSVEELALTVDGGRVTASGTVSAEGAGGRLVGEAAAAGLEVQTLRRRLGLGPVPLAGRLEGQFAIQGVGRGLNEALRGARISAVLAMRGGSIGREVIEMASTDVRTLFRTSRGMTPVTCLLVGVDMRAGVGTLSPMRVRSAEGTIAGSGRFDLNRRTLDVTIGSESRSTGFFALDVPVRVAGGFASPDIRPAQWSAQGRAALAAADDLSALPAALQGMARRYPCPPSRR